MFKSQWDFIAPSLGAQFMFLKFNLHFMLKNWNKHNAVFYDHIKLNDQRDQCTFQSV